MEGKFLGIPLVIILLVIGVAALTDIPMFALHSSDSQKLQLLEDTIIMEHVSAAPSPTATPSMTPTPTPTSSVYKKVSSESGRLR